MTDFDPLECERAGAALALLSGEIDQKEALRRLIETGLDPDEARGFLEEAATDRIAR